MINHRKLSCEDYGVTYFLLVLKAIDNGSEFTQKLISLFVKFHLSSNQLGKVSKRLRRIDNLFELEIFGHMGFFGGGVHSS